MAPSMFRALRRKSKASFNTEKSSTEVNDTSSDGSNGLTPTSGSLTPPSIAPSVAGQSDPALNHQLSKEKLNGDSSTPPAFPIPQLRPPPRSIASGSNRYSVSGMTGLGSPPVGGRGPQPQLPVSPYAPQIENIRHGAWVSQKVLIINGTVPGPGGRSIEGEVTVTRIDDDYPPISWPVHDCHFKALVYLQSGMNRLRFDFASHKLPNSNTTNPIHSTQLTINVMPASNSPPLQLAILLAKDSPGTFDAPPARVEREGNNLDVAIRKFRMAAYLWQAYTAEQMFRNKFGRRTFRFEEEWTQGTSCARDLENGRLRNEARIHVIRMDKTLAEIRDLNIAQQNQNAADQGGLFPIAGEAVRKYFGLRPGQEQYVSCMFLDSHWDPEEKMIRGHAALGSSSGDLKLAIFGSQSLHSYPTTLEEVVPAFTDCTPTDTKYVSNDCNEAGSSWENANIGIGAHMHETGHLFGCPHQANGVMLRDYVFLHRSFVTQEAYCTRTKSKGGLVAQADECTWHRLDCLRFRSHPCFSLPNDPPRHSDDSVQAWPMEGGKVAITAPSGISFIEIYGDGDDLCTTWMECPAEGESLKRQLMVTEEELRKRLPENKRKGKIRLSVKSHGGGGLDIEDVRALFGKESKLTVGNPVTGWAAYRGKKLGLSQMDGTKPVEFVFTSATRQDRILSRIVFYHGAALDGMEFIYDDDSKQTFGSVGGNVNVGVYDLDIRRGEYISGFVVRSGFWIDGIQILTSLGNRSPFFGNKNGGDAHTLIPPYGYTICGVWGSCAQWIDGFGVIIRK
ncbi:hypothetical protein VP1G_06683 [Cytospora mali]|uniref:Jacalin-type lectin domain-containing protein n=1 Tax=Cytospora mali TaxID=578113 RepID=A0A194V642_CYTMA|nr:hypothetical protein VP1G_06683 [Valsa mali var. pyri (nom. inval.)]